MVSLIPIFSTAQASTDLNTLSTSLNGFTHDIELLFPFLFGHSQVLTPYVYLVNAATTLNDTVFLDANGVAGAVFVIRIIEALTKELSPQVALLGGTEAKNVFWQVEGAVTISAGANFKGIIIANNAAIILDTGLDLNGKVLSTNGDITATNVNVTSDLSCSSLPIDLLSFNVEVLEERIELSWISLSESNNA